MRSPSGTVATIPHSERFRRPAGGPGQRDVMLAPGCGSYGNGMVIQYGDFIGFHDDLMVI